METKWKDVIGMYLGCECATIKPYTEGTVKIIEVHQGGWVRVIGKYSGSVMSIKFLKPILRPLSDMTESEATELFCIVDSRVHFDCIVTDVFEKGILISKDIRGSDLDVCLNVDKGFGLMFYSDETGTPKAIEYRVRYQNIVAYLLKHHFDLYNLIPSGQALDRTTLPSLTNQ